MMWPQSGNVLAPHAPIFLPAYHFGERQEESAIEISVSGPFQAGNIEKSARKLRSS